MTAASDRPPAPDGAGRSPSDAPSSETTPVSAVRRKGEVRSRQLLVHREVARPHALESLGLPAELLAPTLPEWVPVAWVTTLVEALFEGPFARDLARLRAHAEAVLELGFVRDRSALFEVATLSMVLRHAGPLWRDELSSGRLVGFCTETEGSVTLHDHPWTESTVMRWFLAFCVEAGLGRLSPGLVVEMDPTPQKTLELTLRIGRRAE